MANTSILAAYERLWQHVIALVTNHDISEESHADIRALINNLSTEKLDASALDSAISAALALAKESGEFNGLTWKGEYYDQTAYSKGDVVYYLGSSYVAQQDSIATLAAEPEGSLSPHPDTDTSGFWKPLAIKGIDGKTPVKGTDYFTSSDKIEMAEQTAELLDVPGQVNNALSEANIVLYTAQNLTEEQKTQARLNTGSVSVEDLSGYATKDDLNSIIFPVTAVNGKTGVVQLTASDVGALPNTTQIPTVPTNVSAFTNDAGYLTEHQSLDGLATESYVDDAVVGAQADWNAAEGEPGHVKNRTHWIEQNSVLLEESEATSFTHPIFGQMWLIKQAPNLEIGKTYTVVYNGTPYVCVCQAAPAGLINDPNAVVMGNFSVVGGADTGEPFAMLISNAFKEVDIIDLTGAAAVRVEIKGEVYRKLDPKFLPEGLPYVEQGGSRAEILPETTYVLKNSSNIDFNTPLGITLGKTYIVNWNGVEYKCEPYTVPLYDSGYEGIVIGDYSSNIDSLPATGEPFGILELDAETAAALGFSSIRATIRPKDAVSGEHYECTISIAEVSDIVHKLDPKFLPDGVPYIESGGKVELPVAGMWEDDDPSEGTDFIFYITAPVGLEIGKIYTVNWNGIDYEVIAQDAMEISGEMPGVFLGNQVSVGGADTGEPFMIVEFPAEVAAEMGVYGVVGGFDGSKADFAIYDGGEVAHKLDNRCLDLEWLPIMEDTIIVEETTVENGQPLDNVGFETYPVGTQLAVRIDGVRYPVTVTAFGSGVDEYFIIGDQSFATTPFFANIMARQAWFYFADKQAHAVSVYTTKANKMPAEFLPDGVPYIENKGLQTVLPETTFTGLSDTTPITITNIPLTANSIYVVNWNGTIYNCFALGPSGNQFCIGNLKLLGGADTGEPFLLINNCDEGASVGIHANLLAFDGSTEATMSIATELVIYHKIDDRLLPTRIGEDVTGKSFVINGETVTADIGAEIFNDYDKNIASGKYSHAEGNETIASGDYSHAEGGWDTTASGESSHAEGSSTTASGGSSHAEGSYATASGSYSHAEGNFTTASGIASHAEGDHTTASNSFSHAEGSWTTASGVGSHAEGDSTTASGENQHVQGKCNITDNTKAHIVGNGTYRTPSNAHTLDWDGNAWFAGDVYVGSTSGINKDEGSVKLATETYVTNAIAVSNDIDYESLLSFNTSEIVFTSNTSSVLGQAILGQMVLA